MRQVCSHKSTTLCALCLSIVALSGLVPSTISFAAVFAFGAMRSLSRTSMTINAPVTREDSEHFGAIATSSSVICPKYFSFSVAVGFAPRIFGAAAIESWTNAIGSDANASADCFMAVRHLAGRASASAVQRSCHAAKSKGDRLHAISSTSSRTSDLASSAAILKHSASTNAARSCCASDIMRTNHDALPQGIEMPSWQ